MAVIVMVIVMVEKTNTMKKLLIIMLLAFVATAVHSQEPNQQLRQLEKYLQEQGYDVSHVQSGGMKRGVTHHWRILLNTYIIHPQSAVDSTKTEAENQHMVQQYDSINRQRRQSMVNAIDSIRLTFAQLGKDASESYLYEYHKNGTDTIKYSLAFQRNGDTLHSSRFGNSVYFSNASEAASFDYTRRDDSDGWGVTYWGNYNHLFSVPTDIELEGTRPFDYAAFEKRIAPVLKSVKKLKGTKSYPIYWRHDEGFDDDVGTDGNLISKTTRQSDYTDKHYGLTTGTLYFIPKTCEAEAKALYQQLDSLTYNYVEQHPEQYYLYHFTPGFSYRNLEEMVSGSDIEGDFSYSLQSSADDKGFYILSFTTKGELWIPREWRKLKSYINGELIYLK